MGSNDRPPRYEGPGVFEVGEDRVTLEPPDGLHPLQSATLYPPRPVYGAEHYRIEECLADLLGGVVERWWWHDLRLPEAFCEVKSCRRVAADGYPARFTVYEHEWDALRSRGEEVVWVVYEADAKWGLWEWAVRRQSVSEAPVGWNSQHDWRPSSHRDYDWETLVPWPKVVRPEDCPSKNWYNEAVCDA